MPGFELGAVLLLALHSSVHGQVEQDVSTAVVTPIATLKAKYKTLMLYSYFEGDGEGVYKEPLEFFLETAIVEDDNVDYVIIINDKPRCKMTPSVPKFKNVHTVCRENTGRDPCAFHDVLANIESLTAVRNVSSYERFIFSSGTTLGPLSIPPWWMGKEHWSEMLTGKINDLVKLVGPTISCQVQPHVQSYLYATDQEGFEIVRSHHQCYQTKEEDIYKYEIGMSQSVIQSGFNLDSLMTKYQGLDFRLHANKKCAGNGENNPTVKGAYFGSTLSPSEVKFFKIAGSHKLGIATTKGSESVEPVITKHDFYDFDMETQAVEMKRQILDQLMKQQFEALRQEEASLKKSETGKKQPQQPKGLSLRNGYANL